MVTWNSHINAAAVGAILEDKELKMKIYNPSDSARNLKLNRKFTFSLTDDPYLFYKASLTGWNTIGFQELNDHEIKTEGDFHYPSKSTVVYLSKLEDTRETIVKDVLGRSRITEVKAQIIKKIGEGEHIQREDPFVDAMVYASRVHLADEEYQKKLKEKIYTILENQEGPIKGKILGYVEGCQ